MLSRLQRSSRRTRGTKDQILSGAVRPLLESLEGRRMLAVGALDPTFNGSGYALQNWGTGSGNGTAVAVQSDGKILLAGTAGNGAVGIARYDIDGSLDGSFGTGGILSLPLSSAGGAEPYVDIAVRPDGVIMVAGTVPEGVAPLSTGNEQDIFVVALNPADGSLNATFGGYNYISIPGGQSVGGIAVDSSNNTLVAGLVGNLVYSAKFTTSGIDYSYDASSPPDDLDGVNNGQMTISLSLIPLASAVRGVAIQSDGSLLLAGDLAPSAGVARITPSGTLDSTYGVDGITPVTADLDDLFFDIEVDGAGNAIVTGFHDNGLGTSLEVERFDNTGVLDPTLNGNLGSGGIDSDGNTQYYGLGVTVDASNKIIATGLYFDNTTNESGIVVARLNSDGTPDTSFGTGGFTKTLVAGPDQGARVAIGTDGNIIVAGAIDTDAAVLRYIAAEEVSTTPVYLDVDGNLVVPGTTGNDTFTVTAQMDGIHVNYNGVDSGAFSPTGGIIITGLGGDDSITVDASVTLSTTITGGAGNDTISGGSGADSISGGTENDVLSGNAGADTLRGNDGDDNLSGGTGNDSLIGGAGADNLSGGDDDDVLNGGAGADNLDGGNGNDTLNGGADNDTSLGGDGNDSINNDGGDDLLYGGAGDDTLRAGSGNDIAYGEAGNDSLIGGVGNDTLFGGDDNDVINGGDGTDFIDGGAGNDDLNGNAGADIVVGGDGNDIVQGAGDRDILIGGLGADSVIGNAEEDVLIASKTSYDSDQASLNTALGIWTSGDSYSIRVGVLSSSYFIADVTVQDDGAVDTLSGGAGTDWFVYNSDPIAKDIVDIKASETGTDID